MPETPNPFEALEQPDVDDSASQQQEPETPTGDDGMQDSQSSTPSSQTASSTTTNSKGMLGSLDPQIPPTPNDWPKVYQAMKAMDGRARAAQRSQGQLAPEVQQKVAALDSYLSIPGIKEVLTNYFDAVHQTGNQGLDIREALAGRQPQQANGQQQPQQDDADWLNLTPQKFKTLMRSEMQKIAQENMRSAVDPLYQTVGSMRFDSEMASLKSEGYVDVPKYQAVMNQILQQNPQMSAKDAYYLAKGRGGGYGRPRPNAAAAFSEGAGSRGEGDGGVTPEEQIRRDMMKAGVNGRL